MRSNAVLVMTSLSLFAACGGATTPQGNGYLSWIDSDNVTLVLDSAGDRYRFDTGNGCMFSQTSGLGPSNFCLTASSASPTGYAAYGATDCSNPGSNSDCDSASFGVVLTADPANAMGCIAVLGDGGVTAVARQPLSVSNVGSSFTITTTSSATAYATYWNGVIPLCGGTNAHEGTYTGTYTGIGYVVNGSGCASTSSTSGPTNGASMSVGFRIDSGGIIDDETSKVTGTIASTGTGTFTLPNTTASTGASCTPTFTITSATKNGSGKWVLTGTYAIGGTSTTFTVTQS